VEPGPAAAVQDPFNEAVPSQSGALAPDVSVDRLMRASEADGCGAECGSGFGLGAPR
jgi:hypothetical protein